MGEGLVLESGTHSDLIEADGAYARLVQAQKLREGRETGGVDSDGVSEDKHDIEKEAREEIPLGRKNTGHSLASEILEQKRKAMEASGQNGEEEALGIFYLFRRMAPLVRDQWKNYLLGAMFACCTCVIFLCNPFSHITFLVTGMVYPAFGVVYAKGITGFSLQDPHARRFAGDRSALWYVYYAQKTHLIVTLFSLGSSLSPSSQHCQLVSKTICLHMLLRC